MRKRYFTSHIKLPKLIVCIACLVSFVASAKDNDNETNIVCFAANSKWVCAPQDQQEIAIEKATKLLESQSTRVGSPEVVIKPIKIPKFNTKNSFDHVEEVKINSQAQPTQGNIEIKESSLEKKQRSDSRVRIKSTSTNNPYASLWSHQLIGVSTSQNAINYVLHKKLNKEDILIIKSSRENNDWWIVLYGLYKDKQTGLDNAQNLPSNIDPPWLRPLANLEVNGFVESF